MNTRGERREEGPETSFAFRSLLSLLSSLLWVAVAWAQNSADDKLQLEPLKTSITVTEKVDAEAPGVVSKLDTLSIESRPGTNLDDRLRDVPGFSLFRRGSSVATHPTTQGISLRGLASSGTSRTLVLVDGLPANDPFGGWVYWSRFNPDTLDRIEVSRGASTSVYGDRAMGGAISLFTPPPEQRQFSGAIEAGNAGVVDLRGGYADLFGPLGVSVFARGVSMDGYYIVGPEGRGRVDQPAGVDFVVGDVKLDYFGRGQRLALKANILAEQRNNGTVVQKNSSSLGTVGLQYSREQFSLSGYHSRGEFRSAFSTVAFGRATETPTFRQTVPSEDWGGSGVWHRSTAPWNLFLGADLHHPSGESLDTLLPTGRRVGGGDLWQHGLFAQSDFALGSRARLHAGLRHDFTGRGNTFLSPSAGLVIADGPRRWRASVYRSFRAPTLNELFRAFSVGNALTIANPDLRPETLVGGEAGVDWQTRTVLVRSTMFWNEINNLVTNVTLTPTMRQRQNLGSATTRGGEVELEKVFRHFQASAAYLFVDARLDNRRRIPQVGKHQGSAQVLYQYRGTLASIGVRSYSLQFEDDLNSLLLPGFAAAQLLVRQRLGKGFAAVASFENLLNRAFQVGYTTYPARPPTPILGGPRLWRAGLRWASGR